MIRSENQIQIYVILLQTSDLKQIAEKALLVINYLAHNLKIMTHIITLVRTIQTKNKILYLDAI
jgi:hypothetical protein